MQTIDGIVERTFQLITPPQAAQEGLFPAVYMVYKGRNRWDEKTGLHSSSILILEMGGSVANFDPISETKEGWKIYRWDQTPHAPRATWKDYLTYGKNQLRNLLDRTLRDF